MDCGRGTSTFFCFKHHKLSCFVLLIIIFCTKEGQRPISFLFLLTHLWMCKNYNSNLHFSYNSIIQWCPSSQKDNNVGVWTLKFLDFFFPKTQCNIFMKSQLKILSEGMQMSRTTAYVYGIQHFISKARRFRR